METAGRDNSELLTTFEDGTNHKGDFMDAMARDALRCPMFAKGSEVTPLQGADGIYAWANCPRNFVAAPYDKTALGEYFVLSQETRRKSFYGIDSDGGVYPSAFTALFQ
jgi:hypothetical protein